MWMTYTSRNVPESKFQIRQRWKFVIDILYSTIRIFAQLVPVAFSLDS